MKFLFLILFLSFSALGAFQITEESVVTYLDNAPGIKSLQERLVSAEKLKGSLTRSFLPQIKLSYGREQFTTGPFHSENQPYGGIEAEVNLFNSGKDVLENKVRNKRAQLAELDLSITKARVISEVRIALAHYAYLQEVSGIVEEAIRLNYKNISGAGKRINAGLATRTDLIDFNHQKITLEQELASIQYEKGVVSRLIAVLLGLDPNVSHPISSLNLHPEHPQGDEPKFGAQNSKIILKANIFSEIAELQKKTAQRWWSPKLELYSYALRFTQKEREYPQSGQRNDFTFGFKFTIPIFDGGEGMREAAAQSALARSAEYQLRKRSLEVEKDTLDAVKKLELAHTLIHGAEKSVQLMTDYRLAIINEYNKGVKNSPDVLQATQRWIEAKTKFADVKKNYQIAKAEALYLQSLSLSLE